MPAKANHRKAVVVLSVVLLHIALIYGVQRGLLTPKPELVIPVVLTSRLIEPPELKVAIAAAMPTTTPAVLPAAIPATGPAIPPVPPPTPLQPPKKMAMPAAADVPSPRVTADSAAAVNQQAGPATAQPAAAATAATSASPASTEAGSGSAQLPSSDADYLQNPKPSYPAISRRLNEQGQTRVRVLIGADGQPQRAEVSQSSGFARLDSAAVATAMRWRYVPGKRNGVPETMWFTVPINWTLSD